MKNTHHQHPDNSNPEKPENWHSPLRELSKYDQFVVFKSSKGKRKTVDHHTGKRTINPFKSANWTSAAIAIASARRLGKRYGIAFVLTANDPFFLFIVNDSPTTLYTIGSYKGKAPAHATKNIEYNSELYTEKCLYVITGKQCQGEPTEDKTEALHELINKFFTPPTVNIKREYLQTIMVRGAALRYLLANMDPLDLATLSPRPGLDMLTLVGAGPYFPPIQREEMECITHMDAQPIGDSEDKPFPNHGDLTPIMNLLRSGGVGYGYPHNVAE